MSRIGKQPIKLPASVSVQIDDRTVTVKGKTTLEHSMPACISASVEDGELIVTRVDDTRQSKAMHGLTRSLLNNMVVGVHEGFKKNLEIRGVGYRAAVSGQKLTVSVGYSNPVEYTVPDGVTVTINDNTKVVVEGADRQQVGQVAATIRGFRPPEPYKGKGIRYVGEYVLQKEGKSVK